MYPMSLQEDLEEFRILALEEQDQLNELGEPFDLYAVKEKLDPLLESIVQSRSVSLSGTVWVPVIDEETGSIEGRAIAMEPVDGRSNGVYAMEDSEELDGVLITRAVIGYWALTGALIKQDCVHDKKISLMAFAPVESSQLSVPEDNMPNFETMMPDDDDVIAQEIDKAILGSKLDFHHLGEIFASIPHDSSLQINFYLNYLNHIFPTEGISFAMLINNYLEIDTTDGEIVKNEMLREYAGEIDGFQCIIADDETILSIMLANNDEDVDFITLVPVRALMFYKHAESI